jgi:hypothetical protein
VSAGSVSARMAASSDDDHRHKRVGGRLEDPRDSVSVDDLDGDTGVGSDRLGHTGVALADVEPVHGCAEGQGECLRRAQHVCCGRGVVDDGQNVCHHWILQVPSRRVT